MFMNTLLEPYYEKMIENAMRNFTEIVWFRELIENDIKTKKLEIVKSPISRGPIEKDKEIKVIFSNQQHMGHASYVAYPSYYPKINHTFYGTYPPPMRLMNFHSTATSTPTQAQPIQNPQLNNPSNNQGQRMSPKQLHSHVLYRATSSINSKKVSGPNSY